MADKKSLLSLLEDDDDEVRLSSLLVLFSSHGVVGSVQPTALKSFWGGERRGMMSLLGMLANMHSDKP
jgi:hypothetical protein